MNKKGATSISVLILVVMALVLSGAALFVFNIKEKNFSSQISNVKIVENIYSEEEQVKFILGQAGEKAFKSSYNDKLEFWDIDIFKEKFKGNIDKYKGNNSYLQQIKQLVDSDNYGIIYDKAKVNYDKKISLVFNDFQFSNQEGLINVVYKTDIVVKVVG